METLKYMHSFTDKDFTEDFLDNLIFNENPKIQKMKGFSKLNLQDKEQIISFVKQYKINKGFAIFQNFINAMNLKNLWNPYAFLEIADKISVDEECNELLLHNCIAPITKYILEKDFQWDVFKIAYNVKKDVAEACKIFELQKDEQLACIKDLENGVNEDFSVYKIKKYGEEAIVHAKRFDDIEDYEEAHRIKFFGDFPEIVDKYIGNVPNSVLSVILLFKKAQENLTPLDMYESKFKKFGFWEKNLGFINEIITDDEISMGVASNILIMYQLLHGANIEQYGNEPIKNIFMEKVYKFKKNDKIPPFTTRREALSDERSVYIINADRSSFRFCESSIPYLVNGIENMIAGFNRGDLRDCKMDWRPINEHQNVTLRAVYFDTKEIKEAFDLFTPFSVKQIFSIVPVDTIIDLLHNFSILGNKINCYDPILLIAINVLYKSGYDVKRWCKAYMVDPLMFAYCFNRAIAGYLMGADDYTRLFNYEGPQWFDSFKEISFMIREHYNLAATCFNYLMFKTSKIAEFQNNLNLDFDFPHKVILEGVHGKKEFDLYDVLNDPTGYANLVRKTFVGDVCCKIDSEKRLIIFQNHGGDSHV